MHHKKKLSLKGDLLMRPKLGGRKWVIFQPLILPRLMAAVLIRAELVINEITCPKWNKSQNRHLNKDCLIKHPYRVAVIDQSHLLVQSKTQNTLLAVIPLKSFCLKLIQQRQMCQHSNRTLLCF